MFYFLRFQKFRLEEICNNGKSSLDSAKALVRRILMPSLARTFSITGLGTKRQKTKEPFKEHSMYNVVVQVIIGNMIYSSFNLICNY